MKNEDETEEFFKKLYHIRCPIAKSNIDYITETKKQVDSMIKNMTEALNKDLEILSLPTGYPGDKIMTETNSNRIYSSIIDKYIDARTGKVIEEE